MPWSLPPSLEMHVQGRVVLMVGEMADALERYFWDVKVLIYHLQRGS
jgi:hypothetical protein